MSLRHCLIRSGFGDIESRSLSPSTGQVCRNEDWKIMDITCKFMVTLSRAPFKIFKVYLLFIYIPLLKMRNVIFFLLNYIAYVHNTYTEDSTLQSTGISVMWRLYQGRKVLFYKTNAWWKLHNYVNNTHKVKSMQIKCWLLYMTLKNTWPVANTIV